jgi:pilus assembly protein CpaF
MLFMADVLAGGERRGARAAIVSKRHARLVFEAGRYVVTDLDGTNGTYVNRRRIDAPTVFHPGDRIYVGDYVLRIEGPESQS